MNRILYKTLVIFLASMLLVSCGGTASPTQDVNAVASRKVQVQRMCFLQKIDGQIEHLVIRKWKMILQNGQLIFTSRMAQSQSRLQAAENVVGNLERGFILVHRDRTAKVRVCGDRDARDDGFDVASMIQQRSKAGP